MSNRGFSLAEVIMALAVAAVGLLALAGAVAYSTRTGAQAARQTTALQYAKQLLQLSKLYNLPKVNPINDAASARTAIDGAPFVGVMQPDANYKRNLRMVPLATSATDYRSQLYRIDVSVFWFDRGREVQLRDSALHRAP